MMVPETGHANRRPVSRAAPQRQLVHPLRHRPPEKVRLTTIYVFGWI